VSKVSQLGDGSLEIETLPGQDARPAVARAIVNAGYDLLELRPLGLSLEEIFLQLTRDEPTPPSPDDGELIEEDEMDMPEGSPGIDI
jgi:ABC-2 type transport system ATP-binding protein